jgi:WD40 repeat protein
MIGSDISELAASKKSTLIAAAFGEKTVQVWDLRSQKAICEFATVFLMGARNLALAPDAGILVTGLSGARGAVAAYEVPSGKKLWDRKRLVYPSMLEFDSTGQSIFCTVNDCRRLLRLEVGSGTTLEEIKGISRQIDGTYGATLTVPSRKSKKTYRLTAGDHSFDVLPLSFGLLDVTFSPHSVCLTEAGGPVRCMSCDDGKLQWTFNPGTDSHVLRVYYSPRLNTFFGVLMNFKTKRTPTRLVRFDVTSGVCEQLCDLDWDAWEVAFLAVSDQLVTTSGEIRNLSDGVLVGRLAFPQREYPDE